MAYQKPNKLYYRITQAAAWVVSTLMFKRRFLRNEIKRANGPFVVIANHQASLDFVNLIGATARPMTFVISNSFYNTLPIKGIMNKIGVIPKQQFQTTLKDMKAIKAVVDSGQPVVIYPAGLMCEDGLSTPIPEATYKFLKWLNVDVYMARTQGSYFVMPKWTGGMRAGRTTMDIYRLFSREELAAADLETVKQKTDEALLFDAYREQEMAMVKYQNNHNIVGLENVLYQCPHCKAEFTMQAEGESVIACAACGFRQESDAYGFLHKRGEGAEVRYVSDWSQWIHRKLKEKLKAGKETVLSTKAAIHMIDYAKNKFVPVGSGTVTLSPTGFLIEGEIAGEATTLTVPTVNVPCLPFSPGKYFEIQHGSVIYRCLPEDGRLVMKFIRMIKIFHELNNE